MEGLINLPLFFISSLVIIIAPGPDFLYVTTRGIADGNKAGLLSALGVCVGLLIHTMFAAFGLSAIIQASRTVYLIIQYVGAAYLIYLGFKAIITKKTINSLNIEQGNKNSRIFKQAILTNVFNPKAIVTFMAFLPQFVDAGIESHITQFICLGCIFSALAVFWFALAGFFAGVIGNYVKRNDLFQRTIKYISGTIMIALGLRLALYRE
ncbi:MAG: LysE family translocator [Calditrichaceae bacterium]|nr:LysE family translocator [Calditrichaceae bacterium]